MRKTMMRLETENSRPSRLGFTLLEVLLVLAILGVIAAMVVPQLLGRQQKAMVDTTRTSITNLEQALKMYAIDHDGQYPEGSQEALNTLMQPTDRNGQAMAPYLESLPKDAWGEMLFYEWPNSKTSNGIKPAIWSAGPNKRNENGSGDDVNNWAEAAS
ncbi:type II secretion system major pseudopilin GspG [Rubinisphaera sp. JC750]|uniref:type II secretion system major pseudopilin GspG n=1 Tax=Rubinisphaera sp. JC750 TaxID=2898658 RepID=UPI001F027702|nr:type II secretion system major pseudopilin GspG [Rubinisphaera sp. JC750]